MDAAEFNAPRCVGDGEKGDVPLSYGKYIAAAAERHGVVGCTIDYKELCCMLYEGCCSDDVTLEVSQGTSSPMRRFVRSMREGDRFAEPNLSVIASNTGIKARMPAFARIDASGGDDMCVSATSSFHIPAQAAQGMDATDQLTLSPLTDLADDAKTPLATILHESESLSTEDGDMAEASGTARPDLYEASPLTVATTAPNSVPSFKLQVEPASFSSNPVYASPLEAPSERSDRIARRQARARRAHAEPLPRIDGTPVEADSRRCSFADSIGSFGSMPPREDSLAMSTADTLTVLDWRTAKAFEEQLRAEMTFVDDICMQKGSLVAKRMLRVLKSGRQVASYYNSLMERQQRLVGGITTPPGTPGSRPCDPLQDDAASVHSPPGAQRGPAQLLGYRTMQQISILIQQLRFAHEDAAFLLWFMTLNSIAVAKLVKKYRRSLCGAEEPEDFQPLQIINSVQEKVFPSPRKVDTSHWYFMKMGPEQMLEAMSQIERLYAVIAELAPGLAPNLYHRAGDSGVCGDMDYLLQRFRHYLPRWGLPTGASPLLAESKVASWQRRDEDAHHPAPPPAIKRRYGLVPAAAASAAAAATRNHFRNQKKECNRLAAPRQSDAQPPRIEVVTVKPRTRRPVQNKVFYTLSNPKQKAKKQPEVRDSKHSEHSCTPPDLQKQSAEPLFAGEAILDNYDIGCIVGEGTYGKVAEAWDRKTDEAVAIKTIGAAWAHAVLGQRAYREVQILQQVSHPHITPIIDVFVSEKNDAAVYIVMPFVPHTCENLLVDRQLNPHHKKTFSLQLLSAVAYLHSRGVVHRDIKLSNILVDDTPKVYLSDFGLARTLRVGGPHAAATGSISHMRDHPDYIQTQWYRAPEVLLCSKTVEEGTDMWSMGCIIVEMLTGVPLFPGQDDEHQLELILSTCASHPQQGSLTQILEEKMRVNARSVSVRLSKKKGLSELVNECWLTGTAGRVSDGGQDAWSERPPTELALDLLQRLLQFNPENRLAARRAMHHKWFHESPAVPLSVIEGAINDAARFEGEDLVNLDLPCDVLHQIDTYRTALSDKSAISFKKKVQAMKVDRSKAAVTIQRFWRWKTGRPVLATSMSVTDQDVANLLYTNYTKGSAAASGDAGRGCLFRTNPDLSESRARVSSNETRYVTLTDLCPRPGRHNSGRSASPSPYLTPLRGSGFTGESPQRQQRCTGKPPRYPDRRGSSHSTSSDRKYRGTHSDPHNLEYYCGSCTVA
eukprot:TRINITY_DN27887_c0_g1_i1.p1 TRINITY_DN27887_c0_g1~~TRINITY_DN27887_c0_g1_i1.p1  ORF type:complete len:1231 (+),score=391.34 TRINITY_DN27887_c0_g1_i1:128-3820(+)